MSPERIYGFTSPGAALDHYESSPIPYGGPDTRIYIDPFVFTGRPLIPGPNGTENLAQVNFTALKALSAATAMSNQHHVNHSNLLSPIGSGRTAVGPCGELYSTMNQRPCGQAVFNAAASLTSNGQTTSTSLSGTTAAAAAAAAAAAVAAASAELTCISEEVFMENLLDDYCPPDCINPCARHEDKYLILSDINKPHQQDKALNDVTHNNVSSFGKHVVRPSELNEKYHHDVSHNGRYTLATCMNSNMDEFNGNYQRRDNLTTKLQQVQRRASLPIINNATTRYLGELGIGQNGDDSSTNDGGLTNKLATMKDNLDGFIGDLLNTEMSSSTKMHSESQAKDCFDVTNLKDEGSRWRSASESTGYIADEGGSDDSDSNHDRLINRCSGCLRFVPEPSKQENNDFSETPLINNQQSQQHHYHHHSNHSQHQNQVQSFNQNFESPSGPNVSNSTSNSTPFTETLTPSMVPSTETKVNSHKELTNETTTQLTTKEHKINDYDVNGTSGFNDDLAKELKKP